MALFTKSIFKESDPKDGIRISVMSRHTLEDGITPDPRIKDFDIHMPILGPSPRLVGDYYKRNLSWTEFESRYMDEINRSEAATVVQWLSDLAATQNVTILCVEETCEYCHRRLLAEACKKYAPELIIGHH